MHVFPLSRLCQLLPVSLILLTSFPLSATNGSKLTNDTLARQRVLFHDAESAIKDGQIDKAIQLKKQLHDYPLYPYLDYLELSKNLQKKKSDATAITQFIADYEDSPLALKLYRNWINFLFQQKDWQTLSQAYHTFNQAPLSSWSNHYDYDISCKKLLADIHLSNFKTQAPEVKEQFVTDVRQLWYSSEQIPASCRQLFQQAKNNVLLTDDIIWTKTVLAANNHQVKLLKALVPLLNQQQKKLIDTWFYLDTYPRLLTRSGILKTKDPFNLDIISNAMQRLALQHVEEAIKIWPMVNDRYALTINQQGKILREIALKLAVHGDSLATSWLNQVPPSHLDKTVWEWRVRTALLHENWKDVSKWIGLMPSEINQLPDWTYWQARALGQQGQNDGAKKLYQTLTNQPDYYGLLACERVQLPYPIPKESVVISEKQLEEIKQLPSIKRAQELLAINHPIDARLEWENAVSRMNEDQLPAAAYLAEQWAWYDRAIRTATQSKQVLDMQIRYPLANRKEFIQASQYRHIDPALAFAIARQESLFIKDARSPVGALGIMQLMPQTASRVAKASRINYHDKQELLSAATNIHLGTAYLKQMLDLYEQNAILATAAYNAGPSRVTQWLPQKPSMSADIWIDTIPFYETRHYLKNVLTNTVMYEINLGAEPKMSHRMQAITTPPVKTVENSHSISPRTPAKMVINKTKMKPMRKKHKKHKG